MSGLICIYEIRKKVKFISRKKPSETSALCGFLKKVSHFYLFFLCRIFLAPHRDYYGNLGTTNVQLFVQVAGVAPEAYNSRIVPEQHCLFCQLHRRCFHILFVQYYQFRHAVLLDFSCFFFAFVLFAEVSSIHFCPTRSCILSTAAPSAPQGCCHTVCFFFFLLISHFTLLWSWSRPHISGKKSRGLAQLVNGILPFIALPLTSWPYLAILHASGRWQCACHWAVNF